MAKYIRFIILVMGLKTLCNETNENSYNKCNSSRQKGDKIILMKKDKWRQVFPCHTIIVKPQKLQRRKTHIDNALQGIAAGIHLGMHAQTNGQG